MRRVEELGNQAGRKVAVDPVELVRRAAEERAARAWRRVADRETLRRLNWRLFGPRQDAVSGEWTQAHRVGTCGRALGDRALLGRTVADEGQEAAGTIQGTETCGSSNVCLHCGAKIRGKRAEQIGEVLRKHLAAGGHAALITLTASHGRTDTADEALADMMTAWATMTHGSGWRRGLKGDRWGCSGFIRSTECTWSARNGWHFHHHVCVLLDRRLWVDEDGGNVEELRQAVDSWWTAAVEKTGRAVDFLAGVQVEPIRDAEGIGAYVSKIELELTRSDTKKGRGKRSRTHWQVGLDAADDNAPAEDTARDRALWQEFVAVAAKHRFLSFSEGLLKRFGVREIDEEQVAAERPAAEAIAMIDRGVLAAAVKEGASAELRWLAASTSTTAELVATVLSKRLRLPVRLVQREDDDEVPTLAFAPWLERRPGAELVRVETLARQSLRRMRAKCGNTGDGGSE